MNLLLTTHIQSQNTNRNTAFSDVCLSPAQYLFNGRSVTLYKDEVVHCDAAYPQKTWKQTALSIIALVPGLILGVISRLVEKCNSRLRMDQNIVSTFLKQNMSICVTEDMPLEKSYRIIYKKEEEILKRATSHEAWDNLEFINRVSDYMVDAEKQIAILYRELEAEANLKLEAFKNELGEEGIQKVHALFDPSNSDAKTLAEYDEKIQAAANAHLWNDLSPLSSRKKNFIRTLGTNPHGKHNAFRYYTLVKKAQGNAQKLPQVLMANLLCDQQKPFCGKYFYNALTTVYHEARSRICVEKDNIYCKRPLYEREVTPYFDSQSPQHIWRQTYNRFCDKFTQIEKYMDDERFANWSKPDTSADTWEYFPDTTPTLNFKFYEPN